MKICLNQVFYFSVAKKRINRYNCLLKEGTMKIVTDNQELDEFCRILEQQEFITVDLEFHREKTYYAQLGLIQVACSETEGIIDPLAPEIDLSRFFDVLKNLKVIKVFHSCRQDIEILYRLSGFIPQPLFDSQIAAQICGFGSSVSYESLVNAILGVELDKSSRLTNWCARPLSPKQLEYAISDVTHLVKIYEFMKEKINQSGREHWLDEEMAELLDKNNYETKPQDAWLKIRQHVHNRKYLTILRELAAWRENRAQQKNLPRQTIIKDDCLLNIAAAAPHDINELKKIRNMRSDILNGKLAQEIIDVVQYAESLPRSDYAKPKTENKITYPQGLFELLKLLLTLISQEQETVPHIIADENELKLFAAGQDKNLKLLQGWRFDVFGKQALLLRQGKLSIRYDCNSKKIEITEIL